jgi:hypothetical protein
MNNEQIMAATNAMYHVLGLPAVESEEESEALRNTLTIEQLRLISDIESRAATRYLDYESQGVELSAEEKLDVLVAIAECMREVRE